MANQAKGNLFTGEETEALVNLWSDQNTVLWTPWKTTVSAKDVLPLCAYTYYDTFAVQTIYDTFSYYASLIKTNI